jgi:hypothetical protein
MRFGGGINLLFHFGIVLVRILIFPDPRSYFASGTLFWSETPRNVKTLFVTVFLPRVKAL